LSYRGSIRTVTVNRIKSASQGKIKQKRISRDLDRPAAVPPSTGTIETGRFPDEVTDRLAAVFGMR